MCLAPIVQMFMTSMYSFLCMPEEVNYLLPLNVPSVFKCLGVHVCRDDYLKLATMGGAIRKHPLSSIVV